MRKGSVVTCTITAVGESGLDVRVGESLSGFIRRADLSRERGEQRPERFAIGEKVDASITQIDKKANNVTLSIKAREIEEEKKAMADYGSSDSGASLGDILGAVLAKKDESNTSNAEKSDKDKTEDSPKKPKATPKKAKATKTEANNSDEATREVSDDEPSSEDL